MGWKIKELHLLGEPLVEIRDYQPVKDLPIFRSPQKLVQVLVQRPEVKECISKSLGVKEVDVASEKDPMIQISRLRLRNIEKFLKHI